ncbi:phosphate signaling complex protein PhoU [Natronosporangium hydrolyticum]|uniref:Phosphate-specific transport system accessory protein PhoU n=1 Tax=Natronosporangium hydrolyticum TaxID=2811111 RepID=A0A895YGG6_9ACTN|nr:phosphate signaling complex protein PhoU [Natronosporangium hydrolyticum]QSB14493.1 phosphate signaling complex protein PhoU [Natronosporangium hydrolyticum]
MREKFQGDLATIAGLLVEMADAVRTAIRQATGALLHSDAEQAQQVILADQEIDAHYHNVEEKVYEVVALQAPVASDLRLVLTSLHIAGDLERMGDLAGHVAKTGLRRHPAPAVPEELTGVVREMATVADQMAGKISRVLSTPNVTRATELERDDDAMDDLHRRLLATILDASWSHGVEAAVDMALLARFYERYADHAVNAGQHVIYLITGKAQNE